MPNDKLKILLGNNTLNILAGSETWTKALALQLKKKGHKVSGFSPDLGIIAEELKREGIPCFDQISSSGVEPFSFVLEEAPDHNYDVIIANHWHIVEYLRAQYPTTPIISTIHGILHKLEGDQNAPEHPSLRGGVNQFVSVSEEVQQILQEKYNIESFIIRNFIDIDKFKSSPRANPIKKILVNSNYVGKDSEPVNIIREVAKHYNAQLMAVGVNFVPSVDMARSIEPCDIVVGIGRSVLEGVAMGKLGIVHGHWGTGGVINPDNVAELRTFNFSGRNSNGKMMDAPSLIKEIDKYYNQENLEWGREYICRDHNASFAADMFLATARELLGQNIKADPEPERRPYRRAKDL